MIGEVAAASIVEPDAMSTLLPAVSVTDEPDWMVTPLIVMWAQAFLRHGARRVDRVRPVDARSARRIGNVDGPGHVQGSVPSWRRRGRPRWRPRLRLPLPRLRLAEHSALAIWSWLLVARATGVRLLGDVVCGRESRLRIRIRLQAGIRLVLIGLIRGRGTLVADQLDRRGGEAGRQAEYGDVCDSLGQTGNGGRLY